MMRFSRWGFSPHAAVITAVFMLSLVAGAHASVPLQPSFGHDLAAPSEVGSPLGDMMTASVFLREVPDKARLPAAPIMIFDISGATGAVPPAVKYVMDGGKTSGDIGGGSSNVHVIDHETGLPADSARLTAYPEGWVIPNNDGISAI